MKYKIMVTLVFGEGAFSESYNEEYSGIIHTTYEEARKELLEAKNNGWGLGADSVYIKSIE